MPRRSQRTTKRRKVFRKLPGGNTVRRIVPKTKVKPSCAVCGAQLHGIKKATTFKSGKTINRPYGGNYCSKCMREAIIKKSA